ncbi:MAG: hypothetical protein AAB821_00440 [Patescibacteria group bacterium]
MKNQKLMEWVLKVAVAGEFIGHGVLAVQGKQQWIDWLMQFGLPNAEIASQTLLLIGVLDIILGILVLFKPIRLALLWMVLWGFWTALLRPIVGEPIWDFIERFANWGAPLALFLLVGWPKNFKDWWR